MPQDITEWHGIDRARFEAEIVPAGRPAVLRGMVADWPVVAAGRRGEVLPYLVELANDVPVPFWAGAPEIGGRFGYTSDFTGFNHDRKLAPLADLAGLLARQVGDTHPYSLYAGGVPLSRHLPALLADVPMPLLDPARDKLISLWLGNRTRTAAHWDLPQNLACVVAGTRRFTLFPTDQIDNLYVGPIDFTLAGQPISLVDVDAPDLDRFPRFATALAAAETATLAPGDVLYIPSLYWHAVESCDDVGAMVNFWWRDGPDHLVTPLFALMHAVLTMKGMPDQERRAWRTMFDHYVFGDQEAAVAHLPPSARGVLGETTADGLRWLKAFLINALQD